MQTMHLKILRLMPVMRPKIQHPKTTHQEIVFPEIQHPMPLETHLMTTAPIADKLF